MVVNRDSTISNIESVEALCELTYAWVSHERLWISIFIKNAARTLDTLASRAVDESSVDSGKGYCNGRGGPVCSSDATSKMVGMFIITTA